uniref:Sema domain-containing protein n=1 Tax=Steinernema glaseri TaxID=37863 RepID=A0A1I7Z8G3_9BILA
MTTLFYSKNVFVAGDIRFVAVTRGPSGKTAVVGILDYNSKEFLQLQKSVPCKNGENVFSIHYVLCVPM